MSGFPAQRAAAVLTRFVGTVLTMPESAPESGAVPSWPASTLVSAGASGLESREGASDAASGPASEPPSGHVGETGFEQIPVLGSHAPARWHESMGVHVTGLDPMQTPLKHA
jgi:hypothetical protein